MREYIPVELTPLFCIRRSERVLPTQTLRSSGEEKVFNEDRKITTKSRNVVVADNTISPSSTKSLLNVKKNSNGIFFFQEDFTDVNFKFYNMINAITVLSETVLR